MTDDATTVAGAKVFQGTAPLDADFFEDRVIGGGQGAYKAILDSQDRAPVDVGNSTKGDTNVLGALCVERRGQGGDPPDGGQGAPPKGQQPQVLARRPRGVHPD